MTMFLQSHFHWFSSGTQHAQSFREWSAWFVAVLHRSLRRTVMGSLEFVGYVCGSLIFFATQLLSVAVSVALLLILAIAAFIAFPLVVAGALGLARLLGAG